jgi:hypothetical protein
MSQYLMKNTVLYPNAEYEAAMLEAEAGNCCCFIIKTWNYGLSQLLDCHYKYQY